jgi:hypothetical protein
LSEAALAASRKRIGPLKAELRNGGQDIIGTFAMNGPKHCSGLPVVRYNAAGLAALLGPDFRLLADRIEEHRTPWDASQI